MSQRLAQLCLAMAPKARAKAKPKPKVGRRRHSITSGTSPRVLLARRAEAARLAELRADSAVTNRRAAQTQVEELQQQVHQLQQQVEQLQQQQQAPINALQAGCEKHGCLHKWQR